MFYGIIILLSIYIFVFGILFSLVAYYYTHNKNFKKGLDIFFESISEFLNLLNDALGIGEELSGGVETIPPAILTGIYNFINTIKQIISTVVQFIINIKNILESNLEDIKDQFDSIDILDPVDDINTVKNAVINSYNGIKLDIINAKDKIEKIL